MASSASQHLEWLSLVEVSGSFLAASVLNDAFPQGLESMDTPQRRRMRAAYEEWHEAAYENDLLLPELHHEWIRLVLADLLEYDSESLVAAIECQTELPTVSTDDGTSSFAPDWIIRSPSAGKPRVFVSVLPPTTRLDAPLPGDTWASTLPDRMTALCRSSGVRVGILTNGEQWMVVNAPVDSTSGQASWYARYWFQEPVTLRAFQALLNVRRCFGPAETSLEALLDESIKHQDEVTDTLGEQVRRAVEVLIQALDRADEDRNRELLRNVTPSELYEAGLTVLMRLVFVLCAEQRDLLLLGDPLYDQAYAVSTLRGQLAEEADHHGPEVLERRQDAWSRLLAVFRGIYGGIEHEDVRLPAMGGTLFNPDRFPFLEGRTSGSSWRTDPSTPLPIDNRTVLLLLNSLQLLEQPGGALAMSYKALDVEQIGYVYEGLLEHTVVRVPQATLGLKGSAKKPLPSTSLSLLESATLDGEHELIDALVDETGRSATAIRRDLNKPLDQATKSMLVTACSGDTDLARRAGPFAGLLRVDAWRQPIIYKAGAFMVGTGTDRREQGTHYTSRFLTEQLVSAVVEPVIDRRHAENASDLYGTQAVLSVRVCDPAMGSGAFLVQACRYLSERLLVAWQLAEAAGRRVNSDGELVTDLQGSDPLPMDSDERLTIARRLIAENCLYGVDINPLAVELAKLSLWLITLARGRPFGFLDHNLRAGDSLLGLHRLAQVEQLTVEPKLDGPMQPTMLQLAVEAAVEEAVALRGSIRGIRVRDIGDVERMQALSHDVRARTSQVSLLADCVIGITLSQASSKTGTVSLERLSLDAGFILNGDESRRRQAEVSAKSLLSATTQNGEPTQRDPFHWSLEFPEVFDVEPEGFDAVLSNPPYVSFYGRDSMLGTESAEAFSRFALDHIASVDGAPVMTGRVNTFLLFLTRAIQLAPRGRIGLVLPDSIITNESYAPMRRGLTESGRARQITQFESPQFRNATVGTALVILDRPRNGEGELELRYIAGDGATRAIGEPIPAILNRTQCSWLPLPTSEMLQKGLPAEGTLTLESFAHVRDGINPGSKATRLKLITDSDDGDPALRLIMEGKWITPFKIDIRDLWVRYAPERLSKEDRKAGASLGRQWIWDSQKIVYRQTAPHIIAAVDSVGLCARNSVHSIVLHQPNNELMYALCAYLNSSPFREYYQSETGETRRVFPQVHVSSVKKLRVPLSLLDTDANTTKRLAELAMSVSSMTDHGASGTLREDISRVMDEVDSIVEALYADVRRDAGASPATARHSLPHPSTDLSAPQPLRSSARPAAASSATAIAEFLRANAGWHSKSDIIGSTRIDEHTWNGAIGLLLKQQRIVRLGERRGARYQSASQSEVSP